MRVDADIARSHSARNTKSTLLLVGGLGLILSVVAYLLLGKAGVLLAGVLVLGMLVMAPRVSSALMLRAYRGVALQRHQAPALFEITEALAARAELAQSPRLYYLPSDVLNAFTVGHGDEAAIAVSDGLLRRMTLPELAGVLAHELAHVEFEDTRLMGFADLVGRVTGGLASVGQLMLWINLPLALVGAAPFPWLVVGALLLAPLVSTLTQLALSRTREFEADRRAAELLGDPRPLAQALQKLERVNAGWLRHALGPGAKLPEPSLLRTHPTTTERVNRLLDLSGTLDQGTPWAREMAPASALAPVRRVPEGPRWHRTVTWY